MIDDIDADVRSFHALVRSDNAWRAQERKRLEQERGARRVSRDFITGASDGVHAEPAEESQS